MRAKITVGLVILALLVTCPDLVRSQSVRDPHGTAFLNREESVLSYALNDPSRYQVSVLAIAITVFSETGPKTEIAVLYGNGDFGYGGVNTSSKLAEDGSAFRIAISRNLSPQIYGPPVISVAVGIVERSSGQMIGYQLDLRILILDSGLEMDKKEPITWPCPPICDQDGSAS